MRVATHAVAGDVFVLPGCARWEGEIVKMDHKREAAELRIAMQEALREIESVHREGYTPHNHQRLWDVIVGMRHELGSAGLGRCKHNVRGGCMDCSMRAHLANGGSCD